MSDLSKLSDEELEVKLCELLGWKWLWHHVQKHDCWFVPAERTKEFIPKYLSDKGEWQNLVYRGKLPPFCSSLDEVAKVEAGLSEEHRFEYFERYLPATSGAQTRDQGPLDFALFAGATARQRTIALIQTLQP